MIVTEKVIINDREFIRTYSDSGYMVERDGVRYSEAVDPAELNRTYVESDELVETDEESSEIEEKARAYDILTGVAE